MNVSFTNVHMYYFQHQSQKTKNEQFQNDSSHKKNSPHISPRNTTFIPKFSMLPVDYYNVIRLMFVKVESV